MTPLSLRRLWVRHKRTAIAHGAGGGKRDLALAQIAFYGGARAVLKALDHRIADGDSAEAQRVGRPCRRRENQRPHGHSTEVRWGRSASRS